MVDLKDEKMTDFNRNLVITGGGGSGLTLPFILEYLRSLNWDEEEKWGRKMDVVIVTREAGFVKWYTDLLCEMLEDFEDDLIVDGLQINIHLTSSTTETKTSDIELSQIKSSTSLPTGMQKCPVPIRVSTERPNVQEVIQKATLEDDVSVGIVVCGPESLLNAVKDEAAAAQVRVLGEKGGATEVFLHSEVFGW